VAAYWTDEAATIEATRADAAAKLLAAGFDPASAVEAVGHAAADCPKRVEVTQISDPGPRYVHGDCM
jgi:hypothetical protein